MTPGDPEACWEWKGKRQLNGYGSMTYKTKQLLAHRVAYTLYKGPIPDGLFVLHACDNPPCVNPAHLLVGTHQENIEDARRKGRLKRRKTPHAPANHIRKAVSPRKFAAKTLKDYFFQYAKPGGEDDCWLWIGNIDEDGYGHGMFARKRLRAHQLAYRLFVGEIPPGVLILHLCSIRACCNPKHLRLGTAQENMIQALTEGRLGRVTPAQVREIRTEHASGQSINKIAQTRKLPYATVHNIVSRKTWKFLD